MAPLSQVGGMPHTGLGRQPSTRRRSSHDSRQTCRQPSVKPHLSAGLWGVGSYSAVCIGPGVGGSASRRTQMSFPLAPLRINSKSTNETSMRSV